MKIGRIFLAMVLVLALAVTGVEAKSFVMVNGPFQVSQGDEFDFTVEIYSDVNLSAMTLGVDVDNPDIIKMLNYTDGDDVLLEIPTLTKDFPFEHTHSFMPGFNRGRFVSVQVKAEECGFVNFKIYKIEALDMLGNRVDFAYANLGTEIVCKPKPVKGDLDRDTDVDADDYRLFIKAYGSHTGDVNYRADADFDSDGDIGIVDFAQFANAYTSYKGPIYTPAPTPTPTPRPPSVIPPGWPTPPMPS